MEPALPISSGQLTKYSSPRQIAPAFMNDPQTLMPVPVYFIGAACMAWFSWYHLFNTRKLCDSIAAMRGPRFLLKFYSGKFAYCAYKAAGVLGVIASFFLLITGVLRLLKP
jgi:hypothetical protein